MHQTRKELALPSGFKENLIGFPEGLKLRLLPVECFYDIVSRKALLDLAVEGTQVILLGKEIFL